MSISIDNIELNIKQNTQDASKHIDKLVTSLGALDRALGNFGKHTDKISSAFKKINGAINTLTSQGISKIQTLTNGFNALTKSAETARKAMNFKGTSSYLPSNAPQVQAPQASQTLPDTRLEVNRVDEQASSVQNLNQCYNNLIDSNNRLLMIQGQISGQLDKTNTRLDQNRKSINRSTSAIDGLTGGFKKFLGSLKRIALYRAIRSAMKAITSAVSEGLKNAYAYSRLMGGDLAKSLDSCASSALKMKNQLGSAFGRLLQSAMPVLLKLISWVNTLAEALSMVFAVLGGADTYLQAQDVSAQWGDIEDSTKGATDSVKEYKKELLGLDELNVLSTDKGDKNKGGGAETNVADMFKEVEVPDNFLTRVTANVKDFLLDWTELSPEDIAKKIIVGLNGIVGGIIGFTYGGVGGGIIGTLAGVTLGGTVVELLQFDHNGKLSKREVYNIIEYALGGLLGASIGLKFGGKGALVGFTIGATLVAVLNKLLPWEQGRDALQKRGAYNLIISAVGGIVGAFIGYKIGGGSGALIGFSIGATLGVALSQILKWTNAKGTMGKEEIYNLIAPAIGGILGGIIGFTIGGAKGAMFGFSLGALLTTMLTDIKFDKNHTLSAQNIVGKIVPTLSAITGLFLSWSPKYSGRAGALLGFSALVAMTSTIADTLFEKGKITAESIKKSIAKALQFGAIGAIGFAVGGWHGAMLAITIYASLSIEIGEVITDLQETAKNALDGIGNVLSGKTWSGEPTVNYFDWDNSIHKGQVAYQGGMLMVSKSYQSQLQSLIATEKRLKKDLNGDNYIGESPEIKEILKAKGFKHGGYVEGGHLFFANEDGNPEYIGSMNGKTAVANSDQMAYAIENASFRGMARALKENGGNGETVVIIEPNSSNLFKVTQKEAKDYYNRTGRQAFGY